jgi:phospholipase A1
MRYLQWSVLAAYSTLFSLPGFAATTIEPTTADIDTCLQTSVISADETMTIAELRSACRDIFLEKNAAKLPEVEEEQLDAKQQVETNPEGRLLNRRMAMEALNRSNRFILTPHKRNYFSPISYITHPNDAPFKNAEAKVEDKGLIDLKHAEAEFQFSTKILIYENIFNDNGHLYLGYTNHSFWQIYSDDDSAPFRETDHQPEFILSFTNDWEIFGFRNVLNEISLNHQSNGRGGLLSRSWNRIMVNSVFERGRFIFAFSPWYRIPEQEQKYPGDPDGDDNPDISHYMGHFEFNGAYEKGRNIFNLMLRNNFDADNKGAMELGWSFPVSTNLRGQVKYFNGYGYSLIDYNADMEVLSLGIVFTDLF